MTRRGPTAVKILGLILGAMTLLTVGSLLYFYWIVEQRWSALNLRTRTLHENLQAPGWHRPVLRGRPQPGDARQDYESALRIMGDIPSGDLDTLHEFFVRSGRGERAEVDAALEKFRPALDALRRGASRESFVRNGGEPIETGTISAALAIVSVAEYQARTLRDGGRLPEAAELLLDACQFARDIGAPLFMSSPLKGLSDFLRLETLYPELCGNIARELEILESGFPRRSQEMAWKMWRMGASLLNESITPEQSPYLRGEDPSSWQDGYSLRLYKAKGFGEVERVFEAVRRWDDLPWAEARDRWVALDAQREVFPHSLPALFEKESIELDDLYRGYLSQVRILRVAAHYRATGKILDLEDPFGSRLQTRSSEGRLWIRSRGNESFSSMGKALFQFHVRLDDVKSEIELDVPR